ncbi:MAG: exodeoxyribonuclease VII large subunit [Pirellulales bacterium]
MNESPYHGMDDADAESADGADRDQTPRVLSVWQVNTLVRDVLQAALPSVTVAGEITDLARPQSGHLYFTLKDDQAQLRAVMWRGSAAQLRVALRDGMAVVCEGTLDVYPPRGSYQLVVRRLVPQGQGALQQALQRLHAKLSAEGLFDPAHKRPLPRFPSWIAVVTSPTGAAVRDFLEVLRRRWPAVRVTIVPCRVQGDGSAAEIVAGIRSVHCWSPRPDVLVVTRGGGSLEDLWSFNEEPVVRAVYESEIPVVSGIGHDIDVTLTDLAADVRALTPTEAAELVVPDIREVEQSLASTSQRLTAGLQRMVQQARQRLAWLADRRCFRQPQQMVLDRTRRVDELQQRLQRGVELRLMRQHDRVAGWAGKLESLSPLAVLGRGYTVTLQAESRRVIRAAAELSDGQLLRTRWPDGDVVSRVVGPPELGATLPEPGRAD